MEGYKIPGDSRFGPSGVYASPCEFVSSSTYYLSLDGIGEVKTPNKGFGTCDTAASVPLVRDILYRTNLSFGDIRLAR
jgi:hypothetical protein